MTAEELDRICRIVIGPEWQRPLARVLGAFHPEGERDTLDDRLVRRWANGTRPIPPWAEIAIGFIADRRVEHFRQRYYDIMDIAKEAELNRSMYPAGLIEFLENRADTPWQSRI